MATTLPPAEAFPLDSLVTPTEKGIASRVLARTAGGNVTLFAFDAGEELSEHTAPFDALVLTLDGALTLDDRREAGSRDAAHRGADAGARAARRARARARPHAADYVEGDQDRMTRARRRLRQLNRSSLVSGT